MNTILQVDQVSKYFGGVKANQNISLAVEKESIVGLIGPNGSGKTTLFNSIVGTHPIDKGSISFDDKEVSALPVPVIAKLGLLRTFQQTRIYGKLNCVENMLISAKPKQDNFFSVFSKIPKEVNDKAENLLEFVDVKGWKAMGNKLGNYLRMSGFSWLMENKDVEEDAKIEDESMDELTLFN